MAAAALALAPAAFAAAPTLTPILIGATALSAGLGIVSGFQQASALRRQAGVEQSRQRQFVLQGVQRSNEILQDQIDTLAAINVAAAAGNIDPFSGSPRDVKRRIRERANRQLNVAAVDTQFNVTASRARATELRTGAQAAILSGFSGAGTSLLDTATRLQGIG